MGVGCPGQSWGWEPWRAAGGSWLAQPRRAGGKESGEKKRNLKWMNYLLQQTIPDSLTLTRNIPNCNLQHFSHLPSVLSDFLYDWIPEAGGILEEIGLVSIMRVFRGSRLPPILDAASPAWTTPPGWPGLGGGS